MDSALDTLVRDAMEKYHVPGVAIGMLRAGDKDTRGEFLRGPDGRVRYMRVGGRVYRRTRA